MITTETYTLPAYWASALINNDFSGLSQDEIKEIEKFEKKNKEPYHRFNCICVSEEEYFKWCNDANNIGGSVLDFTFDVTKITH